MQLTSVMDGPVQGRCGFSWRKGRNGGSWFYHSLAIEVLHIPFSFSGKRPGKGLGSWENRDAIISMSSFARHSNSRKWAPPGPLGKVCKLFSVFLLDSRGKAGLKAASTSLLESAVLAESEPSHINKERKSFVKAKPKIACLKCSSLLFSLCAPFNWFNLIRIYLLSQIKKNQINHYHQKKQACKIVRDIL